MKDYYAYKSVLKGMPGYCLLPLNKDAVYVDGFYYPNECFFVLLSRELKEKFQIVPKIDEYGQTVIGNRKSNGSMGRMVEKVERVKLESNYEHYLYDEGDITWFARTYIENSDEFLDKFEADLANKKKRDEEELKRNVEDQSAKLNVEPVEENLEQS